MANRTKTYFLCSTWDHTPDGPIQLGSIVASADHVAEPLNRSCREPPHASSLLPLSYKTGVEYTATHSTSGRYGVWTRFLSSSLGLGADFVFKHDSSDFQSFTFDRIETIEFVPENDYVRASLATPNVVKYIEAQQFRKSVYMVTAIKTVYGAASKSGLKRKVGGEVGLSIDGTTVGLGPVSLGPEARITTACEEEHSFSGSSDFVFAFRLRKIEIRRKGRIVQKLETKGALYDAETKATEGPVPYDVLGISTEDSSTEGRAGSISLEAIDEEDNEKVTCIPLYEI